MSIGQGIIKIDERILRRASAECKPCAYLPRVDFRSPAVPYVSTREMGHVRWLRRRLGQIGYVSLN